MLAAAAVAHDSRLDGLGSSTFPSLFAMTATHVNLLRDQANTDDSSNA